MDVVWFLRAAILNGGPGTPLRGKWIFVGGKIASGGYQGGTRQLCTLDGLLHTIGVMNYIESKKTNQIISLFEKGQ